MARSVLLAITNDAWYGRTGAPYQFLAITALRSAETGLWTARAANTGVSAIIDGARQRARRRRGSSSAASWSTMCRCAPRRPRDFYVRHGDLFAYGCWIAWLAHFAAAARRRTVGPA